MRAKLVAVMAALAVSSPMFAHHGAAAYDAENPLTARATVTDFQFINPHCQVYFDLKNDKGEVEHWRSELTSPNKLARAGWTKHSLKPGDQITVTGLVGKNGGHVMRIQELIGPNGQPLQLRED